MTVGMYNSLASIVDLGLDNDGYLRAIASPVSIARLEAPFGRIPSALISTATILGHLNASGASIVGFPAIIGSEIRTFISGASTILTTPIPAHRTGTWSYVNFITRTIASGASMFIDLNRNGTSIFDAGTRPVIAGAGTFYSSASILTRAFTRGDRFTMDMDGAASGGHMTDYLWTLVSE